LVEISIGDWHGRLVIGLYFRSSAMAIDAEKPSSGHACPGVRTVVPSPI
jgi:hypothetical protein